MKLLGKAVLLLMVMVSGPVFADEVRVDEAWRLVRDGVILNFDELNDRALAVQPGTIIDTELERDHERYIYEVEIRDVDGQEWDVDLDARDGTVLRHAPDH